MEPLLYLDTARLGRMTPTATQAHQEYARLASRLGCPLFADDFLSGGAQATPAGMLASLPALSKWAGISGLRRRLRRLLGTNEDLPVLLASRSLPLTRLAARLLFHLCDNVLVSDLGWPPYHAALEREAARWQKQITVHPIRGSIHAGTASTGIVEVLRDCFVRHHCDGLFLTAVSHDGLRLPIAEIVAAVERHREVRFVVIDGAQALCHTPDRIDGDYTDLFLAGCHKWLGAYFPLAVAFYGRRRSRRAIDIVCSDMLESGELDDPLLAFTTALENGTLDDRGETVNVAPLFSCHGAVSDALAGGNSPASTFEQRIENARVLKAALTENGPWHPLRAEQSLRTGIVVLDSSSSRVRATRPRDIRAAFQDHGVVLTSYDEGRIRLSMPDQPWRDDQLDVLRRALEAVA